MISTMCIKRFFILTLFGFVGSVYAAENIQQEVAVTKTDTVMIPVIQPVQLLPALPSSPVDQAVMLLLIQAGVAVDANDPIVLELIVQLKRIIVAKKLNLVSFALFLRSPEGSAFAKQAADIITSVKIFRSGSYSDVEVASLLADRADNLVKSVQDFQRKKIIKTVLVWGGIITAIIIVIALVLCIIAVSIGLYFGVPALKKYLKKRKELNELRIKNQKDGEEVLWKNFEELEKKEKEEEKNNNGDGKNRKKAYLLLLKQKQEIITNMQDEKKKKQIIECKNKLEKELGEKDVKEVEKLLQPQPDKVKIDLNYLENKDKNEIKNTENKNKIEKIVKIEDDDEEIEEEKPTPNDQNQKPQQQKVVKKKPQNQFWGMFVKTKPDVIVGELDNAQNTEGAELIIDKYYCAGYTPECLISMIKMMKSETAINHFQNALLKYDADIKNEKLKTVFENRIDELKRLEEKK